MGTVIRLPNPRIHSISKVTNCTTAIIQNCTNHELHLKLDRLHYIQAKTYVFAPHQIRDDILPEDWISAYQEIQRLSNEGKIIVHRTPTGFGCDDVSGSCGPQKTFGMGDWVSTDAGDTWTVFHFHGLNIQFPIVTVYDTSINEEVTPHAIRYINPNTVGIVVTQFEEDARFVGVSSISC